MSAALAGRVARRGAAAVQARVVDGVVTAGAAVVGVALVLGLALSLRMS